LKFINICIISERYTINDNKVYKEIKISQRMELKKKQNKILEILKNGKNIEYEIAFQITSSQRYARGYLEDLEKKGLIEREEIGRTTYWKLK
jgi:DNA-binding MarR family transcriptional regulator